MSDPMEVREAPPRLIVITDTAVAPPAELVERVARLLCLAPPRGVLVQLRDHALSARARLSLGRELAAACAAHGQWLAVNDRADLAVLLGAHGLHLGEASVATADARRVVPTGTWISRACHDPAAVAGVDADAVLLSPVAAPRKGRRALGLGAVTTAVVAGGPRVYALGGVDATNARSILAAGAHGLAVLGAALSVEDPRPLLDATFG